MTFYPDRPTIKIYAEAKSASASGGFLDDPPASVSVRLAYEVTAIAIDEAHTVEGLKLDHSVWALTSSKAREATLTLNVAKFLPLLATERESQANDYAAIKQAVETFLKLLKPWDKLADRNRAFRELSEKLNRLKLGTQGALVHAVTEQQPIRFGVTLTPKIDGKRPQKDTLTIVPQLSLSRSGC